MSSQICSEVKWPLINFANSYHSSWTTSQSCFIFVGWRSWTFFSKWSQRFSMTLRLGDKDGHSSTSIFSSLKNFLVFLEECCEDKSIWRNKKKQKRNAWIYPTLGSLSWTSSNRRPRLSILADALTFFFSIFIYWSESMIPSTKWSLPTPAYDIHPQI